MIEEKRTKANIAIAITQILILVIATIAFSWMIGSQIKIVSGAGESCSSDSGSAGTCMPSALCTGNKKIDYTGPPCPTPTEGCCVDKTATPSGSTCENDEGGKCSVACNPATEYTDPDYTDDYSDCIAKAPLIKCCIPKDASPDEGGEGGLGIIGIVQNVADFTLGSIKKGMEAASITKTVLPKKWDALSNALTGKKVGKLTSGPKTPEVNPDLFTNPADAATTPAEEGGNGIFKTLFTNMHQPFVQLIKNGVWAAVTLYVINKIANSVASQRNAAGIMTTAYVGTSLAMLGVTIAALAGAGPPGWIAAVGAAVGALGYVIFGYQVYSREIFTFRIGLWQPQPQAVGSDCNKCNQLTLGTGDNKVTACSSYICHSYGPACEWVNNKTKYETCVETHIGDRKAPVITPVKEIYGKNVFPNDKYDYKTSSLITQIIYTGEGSSGTKQCVPAFTSIKLAFKTDEEAQCNIMYNEPAKGTTDIEKFNAMKSIMAEENKKTLNHTLLLPSLTLASEASLNSAGYELTNGGVYKFYIRCMDVRGNINPQDYQLSFCVQNEPDMDGPEVTGMNPPQDSFLPYGIVNISEFQVYTNEPADCRWDTKNVGYGLMLHNFPRCSQRVDDPLVGFDFGCQDNLTGFKSGEDNKYYVACIDQPELKGTAKENSRNVGDTYGITFKGTGRLLIDDVKINGMPNSSTLKGSEDNSDVELEITLSGGAEDGNAICSYSEDKTPIKSYSLFENGGDINYVNPNIQTLYMPGANYNLFIRCEDIAGNYNTTMVNFTIEVDKLAPTIVRVFKDEEQNALKVMTNEVAECVYSTIDSTCAYEFDDGETMTTAEDGKEHYVEWNSNNNFYIKCKDEFGNMPLSGCSIQARPFDIIGSQPEI